jgi:hypothetical protein
MGLRPFRTIAYFVGIYAVVLAALYILGYWGSFQFNVLEFIGLGDVLSYALYPLLVAVIPVIVGAAWSEWSRGNLFPPGGGADTSIGQFGRRHWRALLITNYIVTLLIVYFGPEPGKWLLLEIPIMSFAVALTHVDYIIELVPNPQTRSAVLWFVLSIAAFVFYTGRLNAYNVRQGRAPMLVDVIASGLSLQSDEQHPVSYVGHVGDCFVLYQSIGSRLVILKTDKFGALVLMRNPKIEKAATAPAKQSSPSAVASPAGKVPN